MIWHNFAEQNAHAAIPANCYKNGTKAKSENDQLCHSILKINPSSSISTLGQNTKWTQLDCYIFTANSNSCRQRKTVWPLQTVLYPADGLGHFISIYLNCILQA